MNPRAALGAFLAAILATPAWAAPPLWTAHGAACEVVMFGSVHILPEGLHWRPPALDAALARADELWFEIPLDGETEAVTTAMGQAHVFLPEGQALSGLLSKAGAKRLKAETTAYGLSPERVERMAPWFADLVISSAVYGHAGGRTDQGVEQQLAQAAPQAARKAFETAAQQIDMFSGAPRGDQVASLETTLKEAANGPAEYRRLIGDWLKGDDRGIYQREVIALKRDAPALFDALITRRNAAWTQVLAERLKQPCRTVVVVVGVGHLLGPDGTPARLRALGVRVDGPKN